MTTTNILLSVTIFLLAIIASIMVARLFAKKKKETAPASKYNPNWASVIRDVLIAANMTGQLPLALICLVLIVAFILMGGPNVYNLFLQSLNIFKTFGAIGWVLFLISVIVSTLSVNSMKKSHKREIEHIEKEREVLQLKSSEPNLNETKLQVPKKTIKK